MKTNVTNAELFLTAAELRQRWKVSGMFIWRMRRDNKLKSYRIGDRGVRFKMDDVLAIESKAAI